MEELRVVAKGGLAKESPLMFDTMLQLLMLCTYEREPREGRVIKKEGCEQSDEKEGLSFMSQRQMTVI
jgi:hypothetical protein